MVDKMLGLENYFKSAYFILTTLSVSGIIGAYYIGKIVELNRWKKIMKYLNTKDYFKLKEYL